MLYSILYSVQAYIDYSLSLLGFYSNCVCFLSWWRWQSLFTKRSVWVSTERWIWVSKLYCLLMWTIRMGRPLHTCSYCMSLFTELSMDSAYHKLTFLHLVVAYRFQYQGNQILDSQCMWLNIDIKVYVAHSYQAMHISVRILELQANQISLIGSCANRYFRCTKVTIWNSVCVCWITQVHFCCLQKFHCQWYNH